MADQSHQWKKKLAVVVRGNEVFTVEQSFESSPPETEIVKTNLVDHHISKASAGWREIVGIVNQAAIALDHANEHHRLCGALQASDISVLEDDISVECEFRDEDEPPLSSYTAPEQLTSIETQNHLTELYRLGVVFYKLLTGREPFRASKPELLREQILDDVPQPPRQLVHGIPKELDSICLRLLAKSPRERIQSGRQLVDDLDRVLRQYDEGAGLRSPATEDNETRHQDLVLIRVESTTTNSDLSSDSVQAWIHSESFNSLLDASELAPVSWTGEEFLFQLRNSVSHDEAIGRIVQLGADVLNLAFEYLQQTLEHFKIWVESAELDVDSAAWEARADELHATSLVRRLPRVIADVSRKGIQIDETSWQSFRRWVECTEVDDFAETRIAELMLGEGKQRLRVHVGPPRALGETMGPASPLAIVKARWEQAREGLGQLVLIIGEEGTGKTRLVDQLVKSVSQSENPEVLTWNCIPGRQGSSFHPLATSLNQQFADSYTDVLQKEDLLQEFLSGIGVSSNESTECLSRVLDVEDISHGGSSSLSSQNKETIHDTIFQWLSHATNQSPVLFVVEDLQWADPATLELISRLASNRLFEQLLMIATFRPEFETLWGSRAHQTQVALRRLSGKQVKKMIQSRNDGGAIDDKTIQQVVHATGGVPLFLNAYLNRTTTF